METNTEAGNTEPKGSEKSKKRFGRWRLRLLIIVCLLITGVISAPKIAYLLSHESTDDAYFGSTIIPVSAEVSGQVSKVYIKDHQMVHKGDILLGIDQRDYRLALTLKKEALKTAKAEKRKQEAAIVEAQKAQAQAQAGLADARVNEKFAAKEKKRYDDLALMGAVPRHKYEQVDTTWQATQARQSAADSAVAKAQAAIKTLKAGLAVQESKIKEAAAEVDIAELALSRTLIKAPITGLISKKNVDVGKYVQIGQPLLALVDPHGIWITANFKETQIEKIKIGQPVDIKVDAYPNLTLKGHVDSFQAGTGALFSLLPPENATGNFVKVVQRLPVKIVIDSAIDPAYPLWPGLSVVPSIDVTAKPQS